VNRIRLTYYDTFMRIIQVLIILVLVARPLWLALVQLTYQLGVRFFVCRAV